MAEEDDDRECNRAFRRCILMVEFIIVQVLIKSDLWFPLVRLCQEYMSTASTGTFVLCNGYGNVKAVHMSAVGWISNFQTREMNGANFKSSKYGQTVTGTIIMRTTYNHNQPHRCYFALAVDTRSIESQLY